jgi:hypothetical protein
MTTTILNKLLKVAEPIVTSYLTDVTVHDVAAINNMQIGEVRLWCVRETGTYLCRLSQPIDENMELLPITDFVCELFDYILKRPEEFTNCALYLIRKISDDITITDTTFEEMQYVNYR